MRNIPKSTLFQMVIGVILMSASPLLAFLVPYWFTPIFCQPRPWYDPSTHLFGAGEFSPCLETQITLGTAAFLGALVIGGLFYFLTVRSMPQQAQPAHKPAQLRKRA